MRVEPYPKISGFAEADMNLQSSWGGIMPTKPCKVEYYPDGTCTFIKQRAPGCAASCPSSVSLPLLLHVASPDNGLLPVTWALSLQELICKSAASSGSTASLPELFQTSSEPECQPQTHRSSLAPNITISAQASSATSPWAYKPSSLATKTAVVARRS